MEIRPSKTYFFMENDSGQITFAARYNIVDDKGKMVGHRIDLPVPPIVLTRLLSFADGEIKDAIETKHKIKIPTRRP